MANKVEQLELAKTDYRQTFLRVVAGIGLFTIDEVEAKLATLGRNPNLTRSMYLEVSSGRLNALRLDSWSRETRSLRLIDRCLSQSFGVAVCLDHMECFPSSVDAYVRPIKDQPPHEYGSLIAVPSQDGSTQRYHGRWVALSICSNTVFLDPYAGPRFALTAGAIRALAVAIEGSSDVWVSGQATRLIFIESLVPPM